MLFALKKGSLRVTSPPVGGFKSHPLHHVRTISLAQISLILSVEQQKIDFKMRVAFDFTWAFKTINLRGDNLKLISRRLAFIFFRQNSPKYNRKW